MAEITETKAMTAEAEKKKEQSLPFYQLFSFADKYDYILMISGSIGAIIHGSSMPVFFLLFGEMVNGFGKNQSDLHKMTHEVAKYALYFVYLGLVVCFSSYAVEESKSTEKMEQTFIMIKPDGVQRALVGEIISRFEKKGFCLKGMKMMTVDQGFAGKHYEDLAKKPFFNKLVTYMISGPVVAMVFEGKNVISTGRKIIGMTNPLDSAPGTIRGDFAIEMGRNIIHGSDSVEGASKEIALWFPEGPVNWQSSLHPWIYE